MIKEQIIFSDLITNDLIFKYVFSKVDIFTDFINSVLESLNIKEKIDTIQAVPQKFILSENIKLHDYYLDLVGILSNGTMVDLEMYTSFGKEEYQKSYTYASAMYQNQQKKNEKYANNKSVMCINLMTGNYKRLNKKLINLYEYYNKDTLKKTDEEQIKMILIRLDKVADLEYTNSELRIIRWCKLMNAKSWEEAEKIAKGDDVMTEVIESVRDFLNNPRYQKMKNDMEWKLRTKADAARSEGLAEGKAEGISQEKIDCAKNLLKESCSIDLIEKATGLSKKEIKSLI